MCAGQNVDDQSNLTFRTTVKPEYGALSAVYKFSLLKHLLSVLKQNLLEEAYTGTKLTQCRVLYTTKRAL
ncbi:hypothetical protein T05_2910 [Trichinella murrelli]|uniref:Uncharacterized protein n=1 Tax=Trichinella murrelli TaxID=144512 RepID=A0A0V0SZ04_9BILA|nr:hypothetical protein T05_2910 [Trichinella murrelli]